MLSSKGGKRHLPASWLKRLLGRPVGFLVNKAARLSGARVGLALVYHRLDERPGRPDLELVPATSTLAFERQLRHLRSNYRLVPASDLMEAASRRRRRDRFPVSVTFDDDLQSHVQKAMPILQRLGVPATFFLCGASLDRPFAFWWERLQRATDEGVEYPWELAAGALGPQSGMVSRNIHGVASAIERLAPSERDQVAATLGVLLGDDPEDSGLREPGVRALAEAGFEIGFHTLDHHPLTTVEDEALLSALTTGRSRLSAAAGTPVTVVAYPHGKADVRVAMAARAAGYVCGFTNVARVVDAKSDPHLLGRADPAARSLGEFVWRVARLVTVRNPSTPG